MYEDKRTMNEENPYWKRSQQWGINLNKNPRGFLVTFKLQSFLTLQSHVAPSSTRHTLLHYKIMIYYLYCRAIGNTNISSILTNNSKIISNNNSENMKWRQGKVEAEKEQLASEIKKIKLKKATEKRKQITQGPLHQFVKFSWLGLDRWGVCGEAERRTEEVGGGKHSKIGWIPLSGRWEACSKYEKEKTETVVFREVRCRRKQGFNRLIRLWEKSS